MSAIVLISLAITLGSFLLAIDSAFYQEPLLIVAAVSAIVLVASLEAWDGSNERRPSISTDD
jgi:hypothetical protein